MYYASPSFRSSEMEAEASKCPRKQMVDPFSRGVCRPHAGSKIPMMKTKALAGGAPAGGHEARPYARAAIAHGDGWM